MGGKSDSRAHWYGCDNESRSAAKDADRKPSTGEVTEDDDAQHVDQRQHCPHLGDAALLSNELFAGFTRRRRATRDRRAAKEANGGLVPGPVGIHVPTAEGTSAAQRLKCGQAA